MRRCVSGNIGEGRGVEVEMEVDTGIQCKRNL